MRTWLRELHRRNPILAWVGWINLGLLLVLLVVAPFDHRQVMGLNPFIKPMKFTISIAIYVWTLGWLLAYLRDAERPVAWISRGVALSMLLEIIPITMQAARGTTSHYNCATAFDCAAFNLMGIMILVNTLLAVWALVLFFTRTTSLPAGFLWGIRLGLLVSVAAGAEGMLMVLRGAHTVGAADGGSGLPLVNWSTRAGDLRAAHLIGLHALQMLPLAGFAISRSKWHLRPARQTALMLVVAVVYTALGVAFFLRAMQGRPLLAASPISSSFSIRLVDQFRPTDLQGGPSTTRTAPPVRVEWRFDRPRPESPARTPADASVWSAGPGIAALAIRDGRLTGRTTSRVPILHALLRPKAGDLDAIHSLEIRLRVSSGANLAVLTDTREAVDLNGIERDAQKETWLWTSPLIPGDEARTYVLQPPQTIAAGSIRHVMIQPTDQPGADFTIEFIRLISRGEHLASVPAGVSWQGLSGIYHEAIAARSPQTWQATVDVPEAGWLDLSIGTMQSGPLTFRVTAAPAGANAGEAETVLERTVTTSHRWEAAPLALDTWARQRITLSFSLRAEPDGAIGLWGSPVIRRNATNQPAVDGPSKASGAPPQGVVIVWADTLRRDHLDLYGYRRPTSPLLRQMAAQGVLFRNCLTQATWTKVSTPSLMTSLYPTSHGVKHITDRLPSSATTIAEVYRGGGYATFSYASNDFTGQMTNLHRGFDEVHEFESLPDPERFRNKTSRAGVDRFLSWLDAHRDIPFFAFLSFLDPHDPYEPDPPYDTLWADPEKGREHDRQTETARRFVAQPTLRLFGMPTRNELLKAGLDPAEYVGFSQDWYDGAIRGLDVEIGRMLEGLRARGLDRKTLVVFTGDHGEEFLEHGRTFHGQSVYGELNQVPLILWAPGRLPAGRVVGEPVETIDLMPTLLEMSTLQPPHGIQGQSLTPLLGMAPPAGWSKPAVTERWPDMSDRPPLDRVSFAIVDEGWKLVHNADHRPQEAVEYELYDFERDPLNQVNVAERHPEIVARLAKTLSAWRTKTDAERVRADAETTKGLSQEQLERLRSLGYIR